MSTDHLASSPDGKVATHGPGALLEAVRTDPVTLGWMVGAPPPRDKQVRFDDNSMSRFPQLRWAFSNIRALVPTVPVARGETPVRALPYELRDDIDGLTFETLKGSGFDRPITWAESLLANFTDGIVVLHKGAIVYERYFGAGGPHQPHLLASVSKSFAGLLAAMLVADGTLDETALIPTYLPEMAGTGFADATLRHVMDMTTGLDYSEDYTSARADIAILARAAGWAPRLPDTPDGIRAYLPMIKAAGRHDEAFTYRTCNTDVLAWVLHRVTGQPLHQLVSERLWQPLGCEHDAYYSVDATGTEFAGGGLNTTLRDLARFGEMLRLGGRVGSHQVVPESVIADIAGGADPAKFAHAGYPSLPGWSYRSQFWVSHNAHGAYCGRGIRGQMVWVDPVAEVVIARFGSHPLAGNANLDPASIPAWEALGRHLANG
jgi:CubicO group peptidase (beta-lactamase class C family)